MTNGERFYQLIERVTGIIYENEPELMTRYGAKGKMKCREDNMHHMRHLETAFQLQQEKAFVDYAVWLNGILVTHGMETRHLINNFQYIEEALQAGEGVSSEELIAYRQYLHAAIVRLEGAAAAGAAGSPEEE